MSIYTKFWEMLVTLFLVERKAFEGVEFGIVPLKPLASPMFEGIIMNSRSFVRLCS